MNEIWLAGVSGAVLVTLLALQVTLSFHLAHLYDTSHVASDDSPHRSKDLQSGGPLAAALAVCFFIYMAYALLPIRLRHACIAGVVFSAAHLIGALVFYPHISEDIKLKHVSPTVSRLFSRPTSIDRSIVSKRALPLLPRATGNDCNQRTSRQ